VEKTLHQLASAVSRPFRYPGSVFTCLLSAYLVARIGILRTSTVVVWWDAFSYAYRNDPEWDRGPLVSFTGHAPRLWGAPLLFAAFGNDPPRLMAQWAIGTVAWALLAAALWMTVRTVPAKVVAGTSVLAVALTTPVTEWDFTILSDSLSISLGVIVIACFLWWVRGRSRVALVALTVAAFYWTFVRAEVRLFTLMLCVVLAGYAMRRRDLRRGALGALVALVAAVGWCSAIVPVTYRHFQPYAHTHIAPQEELLVFKLPYIYGTPKAQEVYERRLGMPRCPGAKAALAKKGGGFFRMLDGYNHCPDLKAWANRHGADPVGFALAAPDLVARQVWDLAPQAFGGRDGYGLYGDVKPVLPDKLERVAFRPTRPGLALLFGGLVLATVAAFVTGAYRRRRLLVGSALVLVAAGLVSEVVGVALAATEPARYGIQENLAVRIALLMLVVASVDAVLERRRERRPVPVEAPVPRPAPAVEEPTPVGV
jgi:hypothetical protein